MRGIWFRKSIVCWSLNFQRLFGKTEAFSCGLRTRLGVIWQPAKLQKLGRCYTRFQMLLFCKYMFICRCQQQEINASRFTGKGNCLCLPDSHVPRIICSDWLLRFHQTTLNPKTFASKIYLLRFIVIWCWVYLTSVFARTYWHHSFLGETSYPKSFVWLICSGIYSDLFCQKCAKIYSDWLLGGRKDEMYICRHQPCPANIFELRINSSQRGERHCLLKSKRRKRPEMKIESFQRWKSINPIYHGHSVSR